MRGLTGKETQFLTLGEEEKRTGLRKSRYDRTNSGLAYRVVSWQSRVYLLIFVLAIGRFVCVLSMLALVATRCFCL